MIQRVFGLTNSMQAPFLEVLGRGTVWAAAAKEAKEAGLVRLRMGSLFAGVAVAAGTAVSFFYHVL